MSELVTNKITPGTGSSDTVTLGDSGDTFTIPAGVTLAGSGAALTALPAANLTGTTAIANGGTGVTAVGTSGNVLTSTGSAWVSAEAAGITMASTVATTSGTTIDFTGIPSGTKSIDVILNNVGTNGSGLYGIRLGDAGGFETSGYLSVCNLHSSGAGAATDDETTYFILQHGNLAGATSSESGFISLRLVNASTHTWVAAGQTQNMLSSALNNYATNTTTGTKSLSAELTQIRLFNSAGNTWDSGDETIHYF